MTSGGSPPVEVSGLVENSGLVEKSPPVQDWLRILLQVSGLVENSPRVEDSGLVEISGQEVLPLLRFQDWFSSC